MLKVEKVSKSYGDVLALKQCSFKAKEGEIHAILGSNGAGKSTLFRTLLGLQKPDHGSILYENQPLSNQPKGILGYLPEERSLYRDLKVKEQITYLAKLKKMERQLIEIKMDEWLDYLNIAHYKHKKIAELSKGNQQKVQLICSLIHDPKILVMDEPLSGLDIDNVDLFKRVCLRLKKEGKILLLSSHQYNNIEDICDGVLYLNQGKVLFKGNLAYLKRQDERRFLYLNDESADEWIYAKGVMNTYVRGKTTCFVMEDERCAIALIRRWLKAGLSDFSCEYISLQQLIKEHLDG